MIGLRNRSKALKNLSLGARSTMKFKAQKRQNQLIKRITDQHLVVGIDIAQETHVACAVIVGIVLGQPLSFPNNEDGFRSLLQSIRTCNLHSNQPILPFIGTMYLDGY